MYTPLSAGESLKNSDSGIATVYQQFGAGSIAGGIAGKVQIGAHDVLRRAHAFLRGTVYPAL